MTIRILPEARADLIEAYWFYEEREVGIGDYFIESIMGDIDSLVVYAGIHAIHHRKQRFVASKFPHSIYYLIESNEIQIYAVIDNRRDPEWISKRLN